MLVDEILSRVRQNDLDDFKSKIETREAESLKFIHEQGSETFGDIYEKKIAEQDLAFVLEEVPEGRLQTPTPQPRSASTVSTPTPEPTGDEIYKKFLDQLR